MSTSLRWSIVTVVLLAAIVVPFLLWGAAIEAATREFLGHERSRGVVALGLGGLLAGDIVLPVPSSFVAVASGAALGVVVGGVVSTVGLTLGCGVGWWIGLRLGRGGLERFVTARELEGLERVFARHGVATLLLLRAVPVLAEASVLVAGAARMRGSVVLSTCAVANVVIAFVYASAGDLTASTEGREIGILIALGVPGIAMLVAGRWIRRRPRA